METPSQTVGPFFGFGLPTDEAHNVVSPWHPGAITLEGRVLDGAGDPLPDAMIEIMQGGAGRGFGRSDTDADGRYWFTTLRPEGYIAMLVFARGLLKPAATRVYFQGDAAIAEDTLLSSIDPGRRDTLIAVPEDGVGRSGLPTYRFDIHLQGDKETVFLALGAA